MKVLSLLAGVAVAALMGGTAAPPPLADTTIAPETITSTTSTYVFTNIAIGAADVRRKVLIALVTNAGTNGTHTGFTVTNPGVTFTKVAENAASSNGNATSMWLADVPAGTALTVPTLTCSASPARASIRGWVIGRGAHTDTIGVNGAATGTIDVPANGAVFAISGTSNGGGATCTWTGIPTEEYDALFGGSRYVSSGKYTSSSGAETNRTITATWTVASSVNLVAVAFGAKV